MSISEGFEQFERVNDSLMTRTIGGIIKFWNRSAEKLYGWRKEEVVGKVSHNVLQTQFPTPLEEIESELVRNGQWEGKLVHTTRDGSRVVVKSRWTLDKDRSETVVEMNTPLIDSETEHPGRANTRRVDSRRQEAISARVDDLLGKFANIVLVGGAVFLIVGSAYFIYSHGLTPDRHSNTPFGIVLYWVFPAASAGLLFAAITLPAKHKINVALLLCSTGFTLYTIDAWFSLPDDNAQLLRARAHVAKQFGVNFDSRSMRQVIADLRADGIDAYPDVASSWLMQRDEDLRSKTGKEFWPLGGISNKVSVLCNEGGDYLIHKSDQHGFHNPTGIWNSGKIDVAAVGDSYTQGWCVPSEKNFVALIRERYPLTLNLGVHGNGPLTQLATIREYLPSLTPRIVLWFFHEGTDLADLKSESNSPVLMSYLNGAFTQGLSARQAEIDRILTAYVEEEINKRWLVRTAEEIREEIQKHGLLSKIQSIIKLQHVRQRLGLDAGVIRVTTKAERREFPQVEDLFRQVLLQAKTTVGEWGGQLYFIYLPNFRIHWDDDIRVDQEAVLRAVAEMGVPIIDMHRAFQMHSDPASLFPFRMSGNHYNEAGHRVVAETVLKSISLDN